MDNFWNAGVNMAYGRESAYATPELIDTSRLRSGGDTYRKAKRRENTGWFSLWGHPSSGPGIEAFNRASVNLSYGNVGDAKAEMGDLFNDIMGAVVPGWADRPQVLKNIVIKPDPAKIMEAAQKVAPNAGADIVRAANANGLGVFVNTPAGQVEVTPYNAQSLYGMYPFLTRAQGVLGSISPMTWLAVGGIGLGLFLMLKR